MAVLTYKAMHGGSPRYLGSLVHIANVTRVWSTSTPLCRTEPFADSAIQNVSHWRLSILVAAAQFWDRLPDSVTSDNSLSAFQQQLEHTLFQQSFPDIIM